MSSLFRRELEKNITSMCKKNGFKKNGYFFVKPINENTTAMLNFGMASHIQKEHIFVNVRVGVSHKNIETLCAELSNTDNTQIYPTIGLQIGYVMPETSYKEWDFAKDTDNTSVYENLFMNIKLYGFSFFYKMSDINNVFDYYQKKRDNAAPPYKALSILYYLKGEKSEGWKVLEEALIKEKERVRQHETPSKEFNPMSGVIFGKNVTEKEKQRFEKKYLKSFTLTPEKTERLRKSGEEYNKSHFADSKYGRVSKDFLTFIERYEALPII
jgi:hypothetical protein